MYYLNNNTYYVESIAEHKKASLSIYNQRAGTIPWKWEIPMKARSIQNWKTPEYSNQNIISHYKCPSGLCGSQTNRILKDPDYISIEKHQDDVSLYYIIPNKTNSRISLNRDFFYF